jgi:hypothetical protein
MNMLNSYYWGMIQTVWSPAHLDNKSKYQYEYEVVITTDGYASIPVRCIRKDTYGSSDNFEDVILGVGAKVMVEFPRGDRSLGIIQHGTRAYVAPQNPALGVYWMNRFNKIVRYIDKDGNYSVTSDSGPTLQVNVSTIVLDDTTGESIIIDKEAQTITIAAQTWNVNIAGDAAINVTGDVTLNGKDINITSTGDTTVNCKDLNVMASGNAVVQAETIQLNGQAGQILTTETDPVVDSIFGIPTVGVPTVSAGQ